MYKQATRIGLKVTTPKGMLSVEQLWQLSLTDIAISIRNIKKVLKKDDDDDLSFLDNSKSVDAKLQLSFDILKDIYVTRKEEQQAEITKRDNDAKRQKLVELIAEKQDSALANKSIDELIAELKALD